MLLIIGTVPDPEFPLIEGEARLSGANLLVAGRKIPVHRGTPALLAAAAATLTAFGQPPPLTCLAGDTGMGQGSRLIYEHLVKTLPGRHYGVICFHYLQPDVDWHNRVLFAVQEMHPRPLLIADAGFMYVAKSMTFLPRTRGSWPSWPMKPRPTPFTLGASSSRKPTGCRT